MPELIDEKPRKAMPMPKLAPCPRFDIFFDAHFGLGFRWRKSNFFHGFDASIAGPFFCFLFSVGKRREGNK